MIPGDIGIQLGLRASGTWRPAPAGAGGTPGTYATSLPFRLARASGADPAEVAEGLAGRLRGVAWIAGTSVTGGGYLTVTVTDPALAALAVRIPAAGAACARSDALSGTEITAPPSADLATAATWPQASRLVAAAVTARLAGAAGAAVTAGPGPYHPRPGPGAPAAAVAYAGPDAIRYALARGRPGAPGRVEARRCVRDGNPNPFFAVRYAHADAASVLRWAADLGVDRGPPEALRPGLLAHATERALLALMSWLPERTASAARRRRPDAFSRYLEHLAGAWLDCREACPALPFGGRAAPRDEAEAAARLWLAAAAQTALGTGLALLGVAAPERL